MPAMDHRLTTEEMAHFVAEGFLRFDGLIPDDINERIVEELRPLEANKFNQILNQNHGYMKMVEIGAALSGEPFNN